MRGCVVGVCVGCVVMVMGRGVEGGVSEAGAAARVDLFFFLRDARSAEVYGCLFVGSVGCV